MSHAATDGGVRTRSPFMLFAGLLLTTVWLPGAAATPDRADVVVSVHDGVTWEQRRTDAPQLSIDVARVEPGAPVQLVPVLSDGQLAENAPARRNAPTSSMCAAVGGVVCVNADFWLCPSCGVPIGGVVHDGVPLRSPTPLHEQATLLDDGRLVTDVLELDVRLVATFVPDEPGPLEDLVTEPEPPREEVLAIDEVNRVTTDGVALFSSRWATTTQRGENVEAVFSGAVPRIGDSADVVLVRTGGPDSAIPPDGFVLSATGSARDGFADRLASMRGADRLELRVGANLPARMSIGGHPVLLRDGDQLIQNAADGKVRNRHPRTLIGWNADGHFWMVTVDGRQPGHSVGVTLAEAARLLEELGATDALNLDGGGSTTFVTGVPCTDGRSPCLRNSPSDGRERSVTTALALVPTGDTSLSAVPTPPPPPTTSAPPPTAPPPQMAATTPTVTAPMTVSDPPATVVALPVTAETPTDLAAPSERREGTQIQTADAPESSRGPTVVAAIALVFVGALTTREWRRGRALPVSGIRRRPPPLARRR